MDGDPWAEACEQLSREFERVAVGPSSVQNVPELVVEQLLNGVAAIPFYTSKSFKALPKVSGLFER
jgi:hypothetical protein